MLINIYGSITITFETCEGNLPVLLMSCHSTGPLHVTRGVWRAVSPLRRHLITWGEASYITWRWSSVAKCCLIRHTISACSQVCNCFRLLTTKNSRNPTLQILWNFRNAYTATRQYARLWTVITMLEWSKWQLVDGPQNLEI